MVLQRMHRFLMLWLLVAVQVMAPFIHAHAGAVHGDHVQLMHVHALMQSAATDEVAADAGHGVEIAVAQVNSSAAADPEQQEAAVCELIQKQENELRRLQSAQFLDSCSSLSVNPVTLATSASPFITAIARGRFTTTLTYLLPSLDW